MDVQQLKIFNTVASLQNMSRASETLHISQPSLSKQIQKLEEEVGHSLFDRKGKRIFLNEVGEEFLLYSIDALKIIDEGVSKITKDKMGASYKITIGIVGSCSQIVNCVENFMLIEPKATVELEELFGNRAVNNINDYDCIICPDNSNYNVFDGIPFYESRQYLAVNKKHSLSKHVTIKGEDLNNLDMVFLKEGNNYEITLWNTQIMGIRFNKINYTNSRIMQKNLVVKGLASCIVDQDDLAYYEDNKQIRLIPISDKRFTTPMKICFKREKHLLNCALKFKKFALDYLNLSENEIST